MPSWDSGWIRTRASGIYRAGTLWRIRVRAAEPRTRRLREMNRILNGAASLDEARARRALLRRELEQQLEDPPKRRVEEFGRHWLDLKKRTLDPASHARYRSALEDHLFKSVGRIDFRELRPTDIQAWINSELGRGYRVTTTKGWFRVFRTMAQDAIAELDLPRDPSWRIRFPFVDEREELNALLPEQLARFLREMKRRHPRHYPLVGTLAFTGLRFCHASALRWEDFDEKARLLHVRRRQLRGRVGPVTAVKRAPKVYPVSSELMAILCEHRRVGVRRKRSRGWMFPSSRGRLRCPSSLRKPWIACLKAAGITSRLTVHGLRRTFVDLARRAGVDATVTRSLTGHVTEKMHDHYSSVGVDEQRLAVSAVARLVRDSGDPGGDRRPSVRRRD